MKHILTATLALAMVGSPAAAFAQNWQGGAPPPPPQHGPGGPGQGHPPGPPGGPGMHGPGPGPGGWHRGDRFDVPPGQRHVVTDWHHHHGLYAPPPGQQWVYYNNQYMLVAITSGIIGAVLGAAAAGSY